MIILDNLSDIRLKHTHTHTQQMPENNTHRLKRLCLKVSCLVAMPGNLVFSTENKDKFIRKFLPGEFPYTHQTADRNFFELQFLDVPLCPLWQRNIPYTTT